jgi:hypothetical protein
MAPTSLADQKTSNPVIQTTFDGTWWASVNKARQLGFVSGYYDCYRYDLRQRVKSNGSYEEWQEAVTQNYAQLRYNLDSLVPFVLRQVFRTYRRKTPVIQGGERWTEPHGFFDGMWWRGATEDEQVGFVEGYIWCRSREATKQRVNFSGNADTYVSRLSEHFENPSNEDEKIARALYRFRDR